MLDALIAGQRDPTVLAQLARTRMRTKLPALQEAFVGRFSEHHAFLLTRMLTHIDTINADITAVEQRIAELIAPFAAAVARLDDIPGVAVTAAHAILAEIGVDMTRFPTPAHLASWAKFAPGVKESAGKTRAAAPPVTVTRTWPGPWVKPPSAPPGPTPSSANATDVSPDAGARRKPSSPSAGPS